MRPPHCATYLVLMALVASSTSQCLPRSTITMVVTAGTLLGPSPVQNAGGLQASTVSPHVIVTSAVYITGTVDVPPATATGDDGLMTIAVTNQHGRQLSLSLASNAHSPSPIGDPSPTVLPNASLTQYTFPTGWGGRICVGPDLNPNGSKIEGSFTGSPDIDVSYVDGYTVPITCLSEGIAVSGCNIELFNQPNNPCDDLIDRAVCVNSAKNIADGPAPPFFKACEGSAYTYPNDNNANRGNLTSNMVLCCVGTSCQSPSRQPGWNVLM